LNDLADETKSKVGAAIGGAGKAVHDTAGSVGNGFAAAYDKSGLGAIGAAANRSAVAVASVPGDVIGGAGQAYKDFSGGVKGAYAGLGNLGNRLGQAGVNTVQVIPDVAHQVPVIIRDVTQPTGQAIADAGRGVGNLAGGAGSGLDSLGSGLKFAGVGVGVLVVVVILAVLVFAFKHPEHAVAAVA
jgi:hypothetical protein